MADPAILASAPAAGAAGAALLGVSMGLSACAVSCLPFLGTWVFGAACSRGEALRAVVAFSAGRILAYSGLGLLAGALGSSLAEAHAGEAGRVLLGISSFAAAAWLVLPPRASACARGCGGAAAPLLLGLSFGIRPCAPLGSLLASSALAGSAAAGAGCGLAFGLGATVTPALLLVPIAAALGRRLLVDRAWLAVWMRWGAAVVLAVLGLRRVAQAFQP